MIRHVILRHVNLRILEVILIVVQAILTKQIKLRKTTITLTLNLKYIYIYIIESKLQKEVRNRPLSSFVSFKVIKADMFNIDNHEKDILAIGYEDKKSKQKTNGINEILWT